MSKAFNKISWQYIREILKSFGFHPTWIQWIYLLISSSLFSIMLNGTPTSTFRPSKGIRQGDPLSPFLLIIMEEGLSRTIQVAIRNSTLQGISIHNLNPPLSHTQFVDDTTLMGSPTLREAKTLKSILDKFAATSGTSINETKSQIFFFNTPLRIQLTITREMGFQHNSLPTKYLGIQLFENSLKKVHWNNLLAALDHRLSSWTFRTLNTPSCLILLKSTLHVMPLYLFLALAAPKSILKKVRNIQRNFLWQGPRANKKWDLVAWKNLCLSKDEGGLGLRDPEALSAVPRAKIWWRWLKNQSDLWDKLWKQKYATPQYCL